MEIQWVLVLFTVVSGAGAWLFAWSVLGSLCKKSPAPSKLESIVAFALLVVGGCLSVLHLKHVDRILEALNHPTSGIFIEAALVGIMCAIVAIYFIMLVRNTNEKARMVVGVLGMIVGVVFSYECGASYMMSSRQAWMTVALPAAYAGTAAVAGAGVNLLCKVFEKRDEQAVSFAGLLSIVAGVLGLVTAGAFCIYAGSYIVESALGAQMWVVLTFATIVLAMVCGAVAWKKPGNAMAMAWAIVICGLVCAIAVRVAMWTMGTPVLDFFLMSLE